MKILLVHFDDGAAAELGARLEDIGHHVRRLGADPGSGEPWAAEVVVACLDKAPDRVFEAIDALAAARETRAVPVLFTGGDGPGVEAAAERFPSASFTRRDLLPTALASIGT